MVHLTFSRDYRLPAQGTWVRQKAKGGFSRAEQTQGKLGFIAVPRLTHPDVIIAAMSWAVSSALMRKLPLPPSKFVSSGAQMLAGGVLLALTAAALGEFRDFHPWTVSRAAWLSLLYLIVAGSIIAFTAYVWLIHHESPTKVGTYAYVNPVVAVLVGYFLGGESLGLRTILGTLFVLISVVVITTTRVKKTVATLEVEDTGQLPIGWQTGNWPITSVWPVCEKNRGIG